VRQGAAGHSLFVIRRGEAVHWKGVRGEVARLRAGVCWADVAADRGGDSHSGAMTDSRLLGSTRQDSAGWCWRIRLSSNG
jgi:hypothetical protein